LSKVYRPTKRITCYTGDRFLQVQIPNQQCQSIEGRQWSWGLGFNPTRFTRPC